MKIIALRIPRKTTREDLYSLFEQTLKKRLRIPFTTKSSVIHAEIFEHTDLTGLKDYYGIVEVSSTDAGRWLLKNFTDKFLHDKRVYIREYNDRGRSQIVNNDKRFGAEIAENFDFYS